MELVRMSASEEMESSPWKNGDPVSNVVRHKGQTWVYSWSMGRLVQLGERCRSLENGDSKNEGSSFLIVSPDSHGGVTARCALRSGSLRPSQCTYIEASTVRPSMDSLTMGLQYMCFLSLTKNLMWLCFGDPGVNPVCYKRGRSDEIWGWERGKNLWYLWKMRIKLD